MPPTRRSRPKALTKRIRFTHSQRETMRNNMYEYEWYGDWEDDPNMGRLICTDLAKDFTRMFPNFTHDELYGKIKSWCASEKSRLVTQGILYKSSDGYYFLDGWEWDEDSRELVKKEYEVGDDVLRKRLGDMISQMLSRGLGEMVTTVYKEQFEAEPERAKLRKEREEEELAKERRMKQALMRQLGLTEGRTAGKGTDGEIKEKEE